MRRFFSYFLSLLCLIGCTTAPSTDLLTRLNTAAQEGYIYFGQEDATIYGHYSTSWSDPLFQGDILSVCGKQLTVVGFDLGGLEVGDSLNLDGVPFQVIANAACEHISKGGIVTFSWHPLNPMTLNNAWDTCGIRNADINDIEQTIKPWLANINDFIGSIVVSNNAQVIFRPWHEHTGWWFWWGNETLTPEQYVDLWAFTVAQFSNLKDNILWAYSPNLGVNKESYMERYPGDSLIDILGFDCYQFDPDPTSYIADLTRTLDFMTELGIERNKPIALTETGNEGLKTSKWWTTVLLPIITQYPLAYTMVWRNAYDNPAHYYAPFAGEASADDFQSFVENNQIRMLEP